MEKNNLEYEFLNYKQLLALQELGFNESCFFCHYPYDYTYKNKKGQFFLRYSNEIQDNQNISIDEMISKGDYQLAIKAPTFRKAFKFFRDKYFLLGRVENINKPTKSKFCFDIHKLPVGVAYLWNTKDEAFDTFEKAESACIDKLIEITKLTIK